MAAEEAYRRADGLLAKVGLADRADAMPGELSGGEQRRVAIARALINLPPVLLADEPTSDLDQDSETEIIELLEELQRSEGFGFVLVTHDLQLAAHAPRGYEMRQGVLTAIDAPRPAIPAEAPRRRLAPAQLPAHVTERVRELACRTFTALDCAGLARVDFFVTPDLDVYLNEINTMPGFTPISMFPRMWAASGLEYPKLVSRLVRGALRRGTGPA